MVDYSNAPETEEQARENRVRENRRRQMEERHQNVFYNAAAPASSTRVARTDFYEERPQQPVVHTVTPDYTRAEIYKNTVKEAKDNGASIKEAHRAATGALEGENHRKLRKYYEEPRVKRFGEALSFAADAYMAGQAAK